MEYRRFGRTGLRMPVFSCGGMRYQQSWRSGDTVTAASQRNLEATIDRALHLGITHIETARGYGTSEVQLGNALARKPRDTFILQTKAAPTADPAVFERNLEESFQRLRVSHVDLFGFHGLNNAQLIDWTVRPGGCFEVAERFRRAGRIRHIGFSTHASCADIVMAIDTGRFDYLNLHYYYSFQDNQAALDAAVRQDMGVFIISPTDKGGRLQDPTPALLRLCDPLSPMVANDLFCLADPRIHTLSIGAARPSDFDEHLKVLPILANPKATLAGVLGRLDGALDQVLGADFARGWSQGIPEWDAIAGGVNVRLIVRLLLMVRAFDVLDFARERYSNLNGHDLWVQGSQAGAFDEAALVASLGAAPFRAQIPALLRQAHALLKP